MAVEIEWIDSVSPAATGNKIYRDTVPTTGEVEIADIANGIQIYQDNTVAPGTEYKYEVQAHDGAGDETTLETVGVNTQFITTADEVITSYIFDGGSTSYLAVDQNTMLNGIVSQSWVVEAKITGAAATKGMIGANNANALQFECEADNLLDGRLADTGTTTLVNKGWSQDENVHQFIMVYDSSVGMMFFEDAVDIGNNTVTDFTARNAGRLAYFGRANNVNFLGEILTIQFYNKALSQPEAAQLLADISNTPSGLVANFAQNKTASTWTSDVGGYTATNQGGVTLG